jgi:hypothetical protein
MGVNATDHGAPQLRSYVLRRVVLPVAAGNGPVGNGRQTVTRHIDQAQPPVEDQGGAPVTSEPSVGDPRGRTRRITKCKRTRHQKQMITVTVEIWRPRPEANLRARSSSPRRRSVHAGPGRSKSFLIACELPLSGSYHAHDTVNKTQGRTSLTASGAASSVPLKQTAVPLYGTVPGSPDPLWWQANELRNQTRASGRYVASRSAGKGISC